jgi:two-component system, NarL family, response regulator DesR
VIRTIVVSNLCLLREALCSVLSVEDGLEAVGASGTDREVLAQVARADAHVAVVDLDTPDRDGLRTARLLVKSLPGTAVVALSGQQTPGVLRRALAAGVRGFASRSQAPGELAEIIRRVARGDLMIHRGTALAALAVVENPLSEREREVLRLAARGLRSGEIAAQLFLTEGTVRNYLSGAMRKLDCPNRLRAVQRADDAGWL